MVDSIRPAGVGRDDLEELIASQRDQGGLDGKFLYQEDAGKKLTGNLTVKNGNITAVRLDGLKNEQTSRTTTKGILRGVFKRPTNMRGYGLSSNETEKIIKKMEQTHNREVKKLEDERLKGKGLIARWFAGKKEYPYSLKTINSALQDADSKSKQWKPVRGAIDAKDSAGQAASRLKNKTKDKAEEFSFWALFRCLSFCRSDDAAD